MKKAEALKQFKASIEYALKSKTNDNPKLFAEHIARYKRMLANFDNPQNAREDFEEQLSLWELGAQGQNCKELDERYAAFRKAVGL